MKASKVVLNFYLNSSLHVAFSVLSFTYLTYLELNILPADYVLYLVFFSTIVGYNFVRYLGFHSLFERNKPVWIRLIAVMSIISISLAIGYMMRLNHFSIIMLLFLGLLTFLYAMPLSWSKQVNDSKFNLRAVSGAKVFIIALVWSATSVVLPLVDSGQSWGTTEVVLLIQRFCWVLVLMIPFEIRDLKYDSASLGTLPQQLGIKGAKLLGYLLLLCILILQLFIKPHISTENLVMLAMLAVSGLFIFYSSTDQTEYYSSFWVEGIPILWLGLILIFGQF